MVKSLVVSLTVVLLSTTMLLAHGAPLMGTVTAISKDSVTLTDKDGKTIVVGLEKVTKYIKDKKAATIDDVKVGTRIVIDAHMDEKTKSYKAESVQIGVSGMDTNPATGKKAGPKPNR